MDWGTSHPRSSSTKREIAEVCGVDFSTEELAEKATKIRPTDFYLLERDGSARYLSPRNRGRGAFNSFNMKSKYYDKNRKKQEALESLREKIGPMNTKTEMEEIEDLINKIEKLNNSSEELEFNPIEFHSWLIEHVDGDEEEKMQKANEEIDKLAHAHVVEYNEWVEGEGE